MKLSKTLIIAVLLSMATLLPSVASTVTLVADPRLAQQDLDTTKNIEHYGYQYKPGSLGNGAVVDKFTFTPQVIVNILDPRFDTEKMSDTHQKPSTKNIKKLLKDIVSKTLEKFPGDNAEQKKQLFINALNQKQGSAVTVNVNTLGFDKMSAPTDTMSNTGATALFDALKDTQAVTDANSRISARTQARSAAIQSAREAGVAFATESNKRLVEPAIDFSKKMIGLYEDGVLDDSTVDTSTAVETVYPKIIESLKRLGAKHSALTGELARLTREASSPSRSAMSTPAKSVASTPARTPASSAYSGTPSTSTPISTIKPVRIDFDGK